VVPRLVVAVAPVADLVAAFHRKLSDESDAAARYMRGSSAPDENNPQTWPQWQAASPAHCCLPLRVPTLLVSGAGDDDVPMDLVVRFYDQAVAAARATANPNEGALASASAPSTNTAAANASAGPANATERPCVFAAASEVHFLECSPSADHYGPVDAESADWARIRAFIDAEVTKWQ
jgi:hypothetical protein